MKTQNKPAKANFAIFRQICQIIPGYFLQEITRQLKTEKEARTFTAMLYYQPYNDFTAQSRSIHALFGMYSLIETDEKSGLPLTPRVVFLAFAIESYLNTLGARAIPFWDEMERLPWKSKVAALHTVAGT